MQRRLVSLALVLFALVSAVGLGQSYIGRLPNHAGYWLVHVEDRVAAPLVERPRRIVFIVVDGLRRDAASEMQSTKRLAARGQCRVSDQGSYTVSRPVYALLSTGLEADRTGSRNNDLTTPLAAESVWEVARRAGLRVRGSSHLTWFQQLSPKGFDDFRHDESHDANVFANRAETAQNHFDIELFHPLYVDEMGHLHGANSREYAAAVARVDIEIGGLLDVLDLDRDDVILTADHGHRAEGGHGGEQADIREVLACFAGPHIVPGGIPASSGALKPLDGRLTAPLLSLLAGVPFPADMRAGEDHLDDLWDIVHTEPAFEADRRAAIAHFREENTRRLDTWLGHTNAKWSDLYARERHAQWLRIALVASLALALLFWRVRRTPRDLIWLAATLLTFWLVHHLVLGDFDYTVVNRRAAFVPRAFAIALTAAIAAAGVHRVVRGATLEARLTLALGLALLANFGHVFVYGWPLGFPLPPQPMRYFPFIGAFAQVAFALVLAVAIAARTRTDIRNPTPARETQE